MKTSNLKFRRKSQLVFLFLSLLLLTFCEKKDPVILEEALDSKSTTDSLMGQVIDKGDYVIFEGDMLIKKEIKTTKQFYVSGQEYPPAYLISDYNRQHNITVAIHSSIPTSGVDNWRDEIALAIDDWNSIPDSRIHFTLVTGTADITIYSDVNNGISPQPTYLPLPDRTIAMALFPDGTNPGSSLFINLDFLSNMTVPTGQKRYNIVHELGHCIGLRHSNWYIYTNPNEPSANQIPGTPYSDASSIMNGGTAGNSWNGFSGYDIRALQVLYPACQYGQLGAAVWNNALAMTSDNSWVYMVQNSRFYRVSPSDGSYSQLGGANWASTTAMTYLSSYVYIARNSRIYKVSASNGSYAQLGGAYWSNVNAMTTLNGYIYLVQNSRFYRVDPYSGSYTQLGGAWWSNTEAMTSLGSYIYLVQNSRVYWVDPNNGNYGQIGEANWAGTDAMTSLNGFLYLIQNGFFNKMNPITGDYTLLGFNVWSGTYGMTSLNNLVYLAQNSRFYYLSFN